MTALGRRAFLSGTAATAALSVLSACGGNNGRSSSDGELRQWYHAYGEKGVREAVQKYADAYDKSDVKMQWQTSTNYAQQLSTALINNGGPDVFEAQLNMDMVRGKQVVPLDDLIDPVRDDFVPATLQTNTVDGKLYGIPMVEDMQLLYYRKSLLRKAKVDPPTTVDALIAATRKLATDDVKGLFVGNDGGVGVLGGPALWSVGLTYITEDHQIGFDDPQAVTALGKLHELYATNATLRQGTTDWSDPSAFINGEVAMQWTGLWNMKLIQDKWKDDFGVLPYPQLNAAGAPSVPIGTFAEMVNGHSSQQKAAKAFVKWLWIDKTEYQLEFNTAFGFHLPPRKSIAAQAQTLKSGPAAEAARLSQQYSHPAAPPEWTPAMSSAYSDALTNVILKGSDPAKELKNVRGKVDQELKRLFA